MKIYKLFRDLNIYMNFVCFELISIHKSIVPIVFSVFNFKCNYTNWKHVAISNQKNFQHQSLLQPHKLIIKSLIYFVLSKDMIYFSSKGYDLFFFHFLKQNQFFIYFQCIYGYRKTIFINFLFVYIFSNSPKTIEKIINILH